MAVRSRQVAVSTSSVRVDWSAENFSNCSLLVRCISGQCWVGDETVTPATGLRLVVGESVGLDLARLDQLWAVSDGTGSAVHVLEVGYL